MKTRYYYNPNMDQGFPGDTNELWVDGKFFHYITCCHTSEEPIQDDEIYDEKYLVYVEDHDDPSQPPVQNICTDPNPTPLFESRYGCWNSYYDPADMI